MRKLTVTAVIKVQAREEERFLEAARRVIEPTRAEDGCIDYRLHRHDEQPGTFVFYENWRSQSDLDLHMETPHIKTFIAAIDPILDGQIDVQCWCEVV